MKILYFFLLLLSTNFLISQNTVINTEWYLNSLKENNMVVYPSNNYPNRFDISLNFSRISNDSQLYSVVSHSTDSDCNSDMLCSIQHDDNLNQFLILDRNIFLNNCSTSTHAFDAFYFNFFSDLAPNNVYPYNIVDENNTRTLTINCPGNKQAIYTSQSLSSSSFESITFGMYPNPATQFININSEGAKDKNHTVEIFNFQGQKIITETNVATSHQINIENLTPGIYLATISIGNKLFSQKFIKK
jgi:hypothetical protein